MQSVFLSFGEEDQILTVDNLVIVSILSSDSVSSLSCDFVKGCGTELIKLAPRECGLLFVAAGVSRSVEVSVSVLAVSSVRFSVVTSLLSSLGGRVGEGDLVIATSD